MVIAIVETSISGTALLLQVGQGVGASFRIRRALKKIPELIEDLSADIEVASKRNADLQSQEFHSSNLERVCLQNEQKLKEIKADKDKIDVRMIEKRWSFPRRIICSLETKRKLERKKNEVSEVIRDLDNKLVIVDVVASTIPDMHTGSRILSNFTDAISWRFKSVWHIARQNGTLQESVTMLQKSAVFGDPHAVFDLASVNNLKLVPGADRSKSVILLEKLGEENESWKLFSEGILHINALGKYKYKKYLAFNCFDSIVRGGRCELRGKASYYAGLCHRFLCYGAENDKDEAIRFMDIGAKAGVFYCLVDLAATYKHGFGVEANDAKYDELVQELEEGSGKHAEVEEAAFKFQVNHYASPFHGCDIDCVYKGFCYLNGICVEKDVEKGLKLIRVSAERGHSLACKIIQDEELHK